MSTPQDPSQYPQYPPVGSGGQPGQQSQGGASAAPPPDAGGYSPPGQYPQQGGYPQPGQYPEAGQQGQYTPPGQYPSSGYSAEPYGAGQYPGGMPPASGGYDTGAPVGTRPREVDLSYYLWLAYIGLGLLSLLLVFTGLDQIREDARRGAREGNVTVNGQAPDQSTIDTAATVAVVLVVLIGLFFFLVPLLPAIFMRRGKNWARIALAVIAGIAALLHLVGLRGGGFDTVVNLVQLLLLVGAVVLMFHPKARPWFRKRSAAY